MNEKISLADIEFKEMLESLKLPLEQFNHRAHLRLAYIYLTTTNVDNAEQLMKSALNAFLNHNGVDASKYHETLTRAWVLAVHHFMFKTPYAANADEFIETNKQLLDTNIMMAHYCSKTLFSDRARACFVEPDLEPFDK